LNYLASLHGYSSYDDQVNFIRETSFNLMLSLFSFSPHLIGGVAKGVVGLNSKIEINIFSLDNKEYISNILEANNDIFIKNEFNKLNYCGQYSDIIIFEDFDSSQDFEIFIYNDQDNFNNSLEYHYNWNIYKLAKVINKLNILNDFEEELKKDFKNE